MGACQEGERPLEGPSKRAEASDLNAGPPRPILRASERDSEQIIVRTPKIEHFRSVVPVLKALPIHFRSRLQNMSFAPSKPKGIVTARR
jgi:hypothetical protein